MVGERTAGFGVRLRRLREDAGRSQEELATRAGLTAKGIGAIERGERKRPYPHTVRALADALDLTGTERDAFIGAAPKRTGMAYDARAEAPAEVAAEVPIAALAPTPPVPPTPLVGRERETEAVVSLLGEDGARLVTLTGPGGVGKTRLALEVVGEVGDLLPDSAAFVALAPVSDPALLLSTVTQTLGLRQAGGRPARDLAHGYLREKRLLLVLDNFEHLLDAAPEVADLLAACPPLKVLATSRAPLRLRGEREYPVAPLAVPDLARVPEVGDVEGVASVRLLVQRAREASPGFELTQANAAAVAAICRRLDGLPLALELVAARMKLLPPTALLARLDEVLPLLSGGQRDLPERQRTMRDTVAWSHDLLSPEEQTLFARLSVFAGGWDLSAAEAVGGGPVLEGLQALLENSLIRPDATADDEAEPRFSMLETVRQYGLERLKNADETSAGPEEQEARKRHAEYCLGLAEAAHFELSGAGQAAWLERLERELDNLRAAMGWLLGQGEAERAARLVSEAWLFWAVRGHSGEGKLWMERALASDELTEAARARTLTAIAGLLFVSGEVERMSELLDEAVAGARTDGDRETLGEAMLLSGFAAVFREDLEAAEEVLSEVLATSRDRGDGWIASHALNALGQAALFRGDFGRAMDLLGESEAAARARGDAYTLAVSLNIQAVVTQLRGDVARTAVLFGESAGLSVTLRDTWTLTYGIVGLAWVAARRDDPERVARLFGAAEVLREKTGAIPSFPATQALYERDLANVRTRLDPETFGALWAEGRAMSLEEAVAEALAEALAEDA